MTFPRSFADRVGDFLGRPDIRPANRAEELGDVWDGLERTLLDGTAIATSALIVGVVFLSALFCQYLSGGPGLSESVIWRGGRDAGAKKT